MFRRLFLAVFPIVTALAVASHAQAPAADWPQWRGAHRDGAAASFAEPKAWPEQLTRRWKVEVGLGYSAPILVGTRVFAFSRQEPNEVMRAIDVTSGNVVWETSYAAPFKPSPAATRRHGTGPKSTPTFANGRLFTLGMSGIVSAFDAQSASSCGRSRRRPSSRCITRRCRRSSTAGW